MPELEIVKFAHLVNGVLRAAIGIIVHFAKILYAGNGDFLGGGNLRNARRNVAAGAAAGEN